MNLLEIEGLPFDDVPIRVDNLGDASSLVADRPVDLTAVDSSSGSLRMTLLNKTFEATTSPNARRVLERLPQTDRRLATLVGAQGHDAVLRVWRFATGRMLPASDVTIHVDEVVLQSIASRLGRAVDDATALDWLSDTFLLPASHPGCSAVVGFSEAMRPLGDESSTLVLVGRNAVLDIVRSGRTLGATRLAPRRHASAPVLATTLVISQITFSTTLGDGEGALVLAQGQTEYLDRWGRYNEAEYALEEERAAELGEAGFREVTPDGPRWRVALHRGSQDFIDRLGMGTDLVLSGEPPDGLTVSEHSVVGSVEGIADSGLLIRLLDGTQVPPKRGTLSYALAGAGTVYKRRLAATQALAAGAVPLPELAALLEMRPVPPQRVERRLHWDSPAVRRIFANGNPTDAQKRAIQLALNTPDIVVIQGPPGTGKTKVIAAIAARIAEEVGEVAASQQVLLTSHQHDAVDNVAARTVVFGLPSVKHGRYADGGGTWFARWRHDRLRAAQEVLGAQSEGELAQVLRWLKERYEAYCLAPLSLVDAIGLLDEVIERAARYLDAATDDEVRSEISSLRRLAQPRERRSNLTSAIRSIRVEPVAFADDGQSNVVRLIRRLERVDTSQLDLSALHEAAGIDELSNADLGERLRSTRDALLDHLAPMHMETLVPQAHSGVARCLERAIDAIEDRLELDGEGMALVLQRFVHDLERDPTAVENALAAYAPVVASTCQAAASLAHIAVDSSRRHSFDTVIVDEAARANPLDLQIPMTLARRRVVLVGDQRQLPHLVDEQLAAATSPGDAETEELKESLFARLFNFLTDMRTTGHPERTVTLDAQYRMHPTLGRFVSEQFYEPHGARIDSPLPSTHFAHEIESYRAHCAVWEDIPAALGREDRGRSKSRPAEARWIAAEVRRLMEAAPQLSFGIITFYRAQVDALMLELADVGLAEMGMESNQVELRPEWKFTVGSEGETIERLRVGTVDAFQGKEFDVVLLSTVRTPDPRSSNPQAAFGHLVVPNRLCVSMSRQRRLLIVVGDRQGLTRHSMSAEHLGPLVAFSELCDLEGKP